MSAPGFQPEPSEKAPWTRTTVLTPAPAGELTASTVPATIANTRDFTLDLPLNVDDKCGGHVSGDRGVLDSWNPKTIASERRKDSKTTQRPAVVPGGEVE